MGSFFLKAFVNISMFCIVYAYATSEYFYILKEVFAAHTAFHTFYASVKSDVGSSVLLAGKSKNVLVWQMYH